MSSLIIRHYSGTVHEAIPSALLEAVVTSLPDPDPNSNSGMSPRQRIQSWLSSTAEIVLDVSDLLFLEQQLLLTLHGSPSELGLVGRLPQESSGLIVDAAELENISSETAISAIAVLCLALRRFMLLHSFDTSFVLAPSIN